NQSEGLIVAEEARLKEETRTDCPPTGGEIVRQTGRFPPLPAETAWKWRSDSYLPVLHLPVGIYLSAEPKRENIRQEDTDRSVLKSFTDGRSENRSRRERARLPRLITIQSSTWAVREER